MKKLIIIILSLFVYISTYAQDPQLFESTWYLQKVTIDGNDSFPPSNEELSSVPLYFNEANMLLETSVCNVGNGEIEFDNTNVDFSFINGLAVTLLPCDIEDNNVFETIYFDFYLNEITEPFSYSIVDEGNGSKILTITNSSGDEAIYSSVLLSIIDFSKKPISIYPNPVSTTLNIPKHIKVLNSKIKIIDTFGKVLNEYIVVENSTEINVANLNTGIYFLQFTELNGSKSVVKFIKN